jgi:hypothetical protein
MGGTGALTFTINLASFEAHELGNADKSRKMIRLIEPARPMIGR